jgi:nitrogen PTS system EIIA component
MKLLDFISRDSVIIDFSPKDKESAIAEMVKLLKDSGKIDNAEEITDALLQREKLGSTGIGSGVAIPHAKTNTVREITGVLGIARGGVDFDSLDGQPVYLIFLIISPDVSNSLHLKALAVISRVFKDSRFNRSIIAAGTADEAIELIKKADVY